MYMHMSTPTSMRCSPAFALFARSRGVRAAAIGVSATRVATTTATHSRCNHVRPPPPTSSSSGVLNAKGVSSRVAGVRGIRHRAAASRRRVVALRVSASSSEDALQTSSPSPSPSPSPSGDAAATRASSSSHQLITFFRFTEVKDAMREVEEHHAYIAENDLELRGRIYINEQGINAQMSGRGTDGERYARWVESRPGFKGMRISIYPVDEQAHPKLHLRYKPQLVQLEGGTAHLPLHDPEKRAMPLNPKEWHEKLGDVLENKPDAPVLLDVRNGYEWDVGHFKGAARPVQESFRETVETNVEEGLGPLAGVDKSRPIMMYCTGGIRCDVYSTVLKEQGYDNVFTLEGGVQAYFDEFGTKEEQRWDNHLFVFDSRLAMTPDGKPAAEAGEKAATLTCHCCGEPKAPPPHRNCPNVDCNRLFLVCPGCLSKQGGFCCAECGKASHVRPTLLQPGRYQRYVHYTEGEAILRSERRGEGRRKRRQRRRDRKKLEAAEKAAAAVAAGEKPRELLRAMRVLEKAAKNPQAFGSESGTLAARTRSIVKAAGLDPDSVGGIDEAAAECNDNDNDNDVGGNSNKAEGGVGNSRYAKQRARLREVAEAIAAGQVSDADLKALDSQVELQEGENAKRDVAAATD